MKFAAKDFDTKVYFWGEGQKNHTFVYVIKVISLNLFGRIAEVSKR